MKKLLFILTTFCVAVFSNHSDAQETVVSIGTGTSVSNGPPARPSSESYGQTLYYPAQIGTSGYITKLVYQRYDTQSYANAMHWTVYLGTTTQTSFFGSLNFDDMIPVGNLTQVFDGDVEVTSTEVIVSFETPFYYDGVDQLVVAVNELTLGKHYSYLKATSYGTSSNAPAKVAINTSTFASVNAASPLASSDQMQATAEQANVDITFSTCLWPTAITATNPTTTTMQVGWTASALNETAWQVEAVPTGEAQGTGIVQNASTNPYTFTGLDHSTVYDFYVRSDCGSNEYSEWKNYATGTTECGINTCLDLDFDSYNHLEEPRCFNTIGAVGTGTAVGNPGDLVLHVGGSLPAYVSLPEVASLNDGILNFRARSSGNQSPYNQVVIGTMSDPNNNATFTALNTLTLSTNWSNESIDFDSYVGSDKYITFYYPNAVNGNTYVYVDDITFDGNGACVFNKTFVDKDATGNNDGTSWTDAYTDLQDALTNYNGIDIWVAEGTYKPDASNRAATFSIPSGAKIYGGFAGTETAVNQRVVGSNTTILSGDLSGNDNGTLLDTEATRQDNSYHVVSLKGDVQNVVLDGFTIADGNANGPIDNSCNTAAASRVYHTRGAAIYANPYVINQVNSAEISNCIFENHTATEVSVYYAYAPCGVTNVTFDFDFNRCITRNNFCGTLSSYLFSASGGYGIVSQGSVTNSLFHDNETTASLGSVFYMVTSTANGGTHTALNIDINGNTFTNNTSGDGSTFYTIRAQSSTFTNNIVWGNGSTSPFNASPTPVISAANLIEGGISSSLNVDPSFVDANNDDFSLDCNSPALNYGDGTGIDPSAIDLAGNARFNGDLDLGAYEYDASFSVSVTESTVCQGDPVTFTASGVTNISWTGGVSDGVPFYPTSTNTYTATGTDGNGCVSTRDVFVWVDASVTDDNVTAPSEVCTGTSATVNVASSTSGATYYLRDNSNNSVVDGPTTGTGSALSFSTGSLTSTKTYNVFAEGLAATTQQGALEFDGSDDYVSAPKPSGFAYNSAYTVEGWVKTPNPGAGGGYQAIFFAGTTVGSDIEIYVQEGTNNLVVAHNRGNGGSIQGVTFPVPPNNVWFHLAVVYNGSTVTAYYDGVSQGSPMAMVTPVVSASAVLNFGYISSSAFNPAWGSKNMLGSLDEFKLWSIARSAGDIAAEMGDCASGMETGLEAYYNFEDGTGTVLTDLANGNNGTLINMDNADWVSTGSVACTGAGCDFELSQTVTIGVTSGYNLTETETVCNGESFMFPDGSSQTITSQTVYTSNLTTVVAGCDSIIETTVNVSPSYNLTESASICSGESYTFPDGSTQQNITSQVVYTSNLQTVGAQCDSIIETTVNVNPTYDLAETAAVCSGSSYTFPDGSSQTITSQVVYTSNLLTVGAQCDSIIETTVNVAPEYNLTETIGVCSGADVTFPDGSSQTNITSNVVYTSNLTTVGFGCDSIIETTVNVTSAFNVSETATVCTGSSYTFPDGSVQNNITSQVVYSSTLSAVSIPCDSIVETTVNVAPDYDLTETVSACEGENYTFPDGSMQTITAQTVYTSNLTTVGFGCDSIIETTVNVTTVDESVSQNGNTLTATESGADYQWVDCDNGNAPIGGETSQDFTPNSSGNYAVEVTVNGCTETSGCTSMVVTGIRESANSGIKVYPVPARDVLFVNSDNAIRELAILSANGSLIKLASQSRKQIDVSGLAKGVYLLRAVTEKGVSYTRFIKQ